MGTQFSVLAVFIAVQDASFRGLKGSQPAADTRPFRGAPDIRRPVVLSTLGLPCGINHLSISYSKVCVFCSSSKKQYTLP